MTTAAACPRSYPIAASALVLANRPLRPGVVLADTARFGDDTWALTPALHQVQERSLGLEFTTIPARFRAVCKELFYTMLTLDLPAGVEPCHIVSIRSYFSRVKEFLTWAEANTITTLDALSGQDLADYGRYVAAQRWPESTLEQKRRAPRLFWLYRDRLVTDRLPTDPAIVLGEPYVYSRRTSSGENTTSRIPETVLAPLLVWALRWVEDFAGDVIDAHTAWQDLHTVTDPDPEQAGRLTTRRASPRLAYVLDEYRRQHRKLPGQATADPFAAWHASHGPHTAQAVNLTYLALQTGCTQTTLYREPCQHLIRQAIDELGIADDTRLPVTIRGTIGDRPWLPAIGPADVAPLTRTLLTACYIVISYLSGMRDSEVKHLQRGCVSLWRDETGRPVRRKVTTLAFKGEHEVTGVEATWIVNASVARAIDVLEQLQPSTQPLLFAAPPLSRGYTVDKPNPVKTSNSTNRDLAAFVNWINTYCAQHHRDDTIPDVNGQPWRLLTRQFRRTLAWFIARQPGGTIAGAIQYRHLSVQLFEGYAGTSTSGFRHEVEAEQAIQRGEKLGDLIGEPEHHHLVGPAAEEAHARLADFETHIQFRGKVITDRKRLERHMRAHDPHIYPGKYVTCVYDPDRALSHQHPPTLGPSLPDCQPLRCRNVALTPQNIQVLTEWITRIDHTLAAGDVLAPYLRDRLQHRRAEVAQFLTDNGAPPPAAQTP